MHILIFRFVITTFLKLFIFLDCEVLICDCHREQARIRWLRATKNGFHTRTDDFLPKLRRIARARTVQEMNDAIDAIRNSEFWKEEKFTTLKEYIEKYWFDIKEVNRY